MRGAVAAVAVAACGLLAGARAEAWSRTGGTWRTLPVNWYWNPATVPPSLGGADVGRMALEAGFATWASAPCTRFRANNAGTTAVVRGSSRDRVNTLSWISGSWPPELGAVNTVIGVTLPVSSGGANLDADIMFNNVGFQWSTTGVRGTVDAQSIAVHEEGHFLGLGHTTTPRESIMFPSYPGRPSRVMSSDDIAGVCALYPGAGAVPDAGVVDAGAPADPCNAITSCAECTPQAACGWCGALRRCMTGNASGATVGSCPGQWAPYPMNCTAAPPPDAGGEGTTMFGGPCRSANDCASGGPCLSVSGGSPFCSQRCDDDCTCPRGYRCAQTTSGFGLCLPGTNRCPADAGEPPPPDAAAPPDAPAPPVDAPTTPDAAVVDAAADDVASDASGDGAVWSDAPASSGCGCRATSPTRSAWPALLVGLAALARRRRRR